MVRRRFIMLAAGGYRWLYARVAALVGRSVNLDAVPSAVVVGKKKPKFFRKSNIESCPAGEVKHISEVTVKRKSNLWSSGIRYIHVTRAAISETVCNLQEVYIGWLFGIKTAVTKRKANIGAADGATSEADRKIPTRRKANTSTAPARVARGARMVPTELSSDAGTGNAVDAKTAREGVTGLSAVAVSADGVDAVAGRVSQVGKTAEAAFWFYPEMVKSGVLVIRQVYSSTITGDTMEVM